MANKVQGTIVGLYFFFDEWGVFITCEGVNLQCGCECGLYNTLLYVHPSAGHWNVFYLYGLVQTEERIQDASTATNGHKYLR
jgi:hypothetical protein